MEDDEGEGNGNGNEETPVEEDVIEEAVVEAEPEPELIDPAMIPSGIIILSGGHPSSYVAKYDPSSEGIAFAVEIGSGAAVVPAPDATNGVSSTLPVNQVELKDKLNPELLYTADSVVPSAGIVKLLPSGDLEVQVINTTIGEVSYTNQFKTKINWDLEL